MSDWPRTLAPVLLSLAIAWAAYVTVRIEQLATDVAVLAVRVEGRCAEVTQR